MRDGWLGRGDKELFLNLIVVSHQTFSPELYEFAELIRSGNASKVGQAVRAYYSVFVGPGNTFN